MNAKSLIIALIVIIIVLGATGGEASAAAVGNALGEAFHLVRVAWEAAFRDR